MGNGSGTTWQAALALIAGVVGAGFASGREAAVFFAPFGGWGVVGVGLTALIIAGSASRPARRMPAPWAVLRLLLVWTTLAVILAAGGEVFRHLAGWPAIVGSTGLAALAIVAPTGVKGRQAQGLLVGILGAAVLTVSGAAWRWGLPPLDVRASWPTLPGISSARLPTLSGVLPAWSGSAGAARPLAALTAALLYASYTSALVAGEGPRERAATFKNRAYTYLGAAVIGGLLAAMSATVARWGTLEAPLPMVAVAKGLGTWAGVGYAWLLGIAAANSAVANAGVLSRRLAPVFGGERRARLAVTLLALAASLLGFANLVGRVYPALGWAWLPAALGLVDGGRPWPSRADVGRRPPT
ncbi:MAG: hypothetical protein ACM3RP_13145 [Chitinophagales bacterium]